jgi:hypothetical protein
MGSFKIVYGFGIGDGFGPIDSFGLGDGFGQMDSFELGDVLS